MDDRIYKVFISSSFEDLKEERLLAINAVLQRGWLPSCMEHFPAMGFSPWKIIEANIRDADFYVLIVGGRYGSITEEGISFTEKELDCAEHYGVPVLALLHSAPGSLPYSRSETDRASRARLESLRKRLLNAYGVAKWDSEMALVAALTHSLAEAPRLHDRPGWTRNIVPNTGVVAGSIKETTMKKKSSSGIRIKVDRAALAKGLMGQLRGLIKPGPGRGGEVRLVLPLEDRGREVEFLIPGRFELSPQIVDRIGVLEGVREVADL